MTTFADLNLDPGIVETLRRMDVTEPTPIQEAAIPGMMAGRDIVGQARTGSGKTLAFGLPLMTLCDPAIAAPQALILVPTRELAGQVARVIDQITPRMKLRAAQIYGGRDMSDQIQLLNSGPQIIIGTPGRVLDHLYRGSLSFRQMRVLVLDEADQMLDQGFQEDVDRILDCAPGKLQMALFSATVPGWVHDVISHRLHDPAFVKVDEAQRGPNDSIDHTVIEVPAAHKLQAIAALLEEQGAGSVLIFARTKIGVEKLSTQLGNMGYRVAALQGNMSQPLRERVLRGFRRGNPSILVATNVAARGLDIVSIEQVINFELPESAELLTHRLGRTGRMGRHGSAVTLLTPADGRKWKLIEREIGIRVRRERWTQDGIVADADAGKGEPTTQGRPAGSAAEEHGEVATRMEQSQPRVSREPSNASRNRPRRRGGAGNLDSTGQSPKSAGRQGKFDIICAACGKQAVVKFAPRGDRPVYCSACFRDRKTDAA